MKRSAEVEEFESSQFRRYLNHPSDSDYTFALQPNGEYKFWNLSLKNDDGKTLVISHHGDVGTDGTREIVGEYDKHALAIRAMMNLKTERFMSEEEGNDYSTYRFIKEMELDAQREEVKKARIANYEFPSLTGKLVYPLPASRTNWIPTLQEFLSSYEYLSNESLFYDFSSSSVSDWTLYEPLEPDSATKAQKKEHSALVKKSAFMKKCSKEQPGRLFQTAHASIDEKIFQLTIDGATFYLLSVCLCVNDPMGHYNVLLNNRKKEIFRIEVNDTSHPTVEEDGVWKSKAMKTRYCTLLNRIEPFITSQQMLCVDGNFEFDWEDEVCL